MKDTIWIYVQPENIILQYESEYLGQIAPHIRNMIDSNSDSSLTRAEADSFFSRYKKSLNQNLQTIPLFLEQIFFPLKLIEVSIPTMDTDTLLAPLHFKMVFIVDSVNIEQGKYELVIDPRLLFSNGDKLIEMAKEEADFTNEQEQAIARFMQIKVLASDSITFTSTFPGYIKKDKKSVHIYGIFYDETILQIQNSQYPKIRIKFSLN